MALRFQLDNGLTVVFEEQHAAKVAAFQVWVKAGSADEQEDQAGLAHLHEHMLFKGTERRGPGEIAHAIEARGGEINAWTSFDQTVYHVVLASPFAEAGLDVLADAVRRSTFDAEELAREIEVVCEEIKRSEDSPSRRASKDLFTTAYQTHPYRRPVIGWEQSVKSFTREKVLEFYGQHYHPQNMVLAAAGDMTEKELRAWADKHLGGAWGAPREKQATRPREPKHAGRQDLVRDDDVREAYLNLAFAIPSVDHDDTPTLDVLAMLTGQGDTSRLVLEVKRKRSLVNDVHAYAYTPRDPGLWTTSLTAPPEKVGPALSATIEVLADLTRHPVTAEELATVKALIESEAVYQRETVQGVARKLGYYQAAVGGIEEEARYYQRVAALTPEHLLEVARKYFDFDRGVLTGLMPEGSGFDAKQGWALIDDARARKTGPFATKRKAKVDSPPMQVTGRSRAESSPLVVEKLPSGATVVVRPERAVPLVAMRAVFQGGLRYESADTNGLTTLLSRTLAKGTATMSAEDISHTMDDCAGALSGAGGRNSMSLRAELLSRHFERGFHVFAECLLEPAFHPAEVDRERLLLLQDIVTREDKPSGVAFDLFAKTLFQQHPYRLSALGEGPVVERLTPDDLRRYHAQHMDPSQLIYCVVGDVDVDRVLKLAHERFGQSKGQAAPAPTVAPEPPLTAPKKRTRSLAKAQTHLVLGFIGARMTDPWRRALEVMSTVLSGQGGRLFVELRDKRSMAYSVSSYSIEGVDPGYFAVYMGTSPEKVDAALEGIRHELERMKEERVSPAELERAQQHLVGTHEIGLQRNGARAAVMALDACYGLGAEKYRHYADEVWSVTRDDVKDVAERLFQFERSALAIVGP